MKGSIYIIYCKSDYCSKFYIGATQNFTKRKQEHISRCLKVGGWKYDTVLYQIIRDNGGFDNWNIELMYEIRTINNKKQCRKDLRIFEKNIIFNFIDNVNCLNQRL